MQPQNIGLIQDLHIQATATLGMIASCKIINDPWGIRYYSRQYDKIMQRLSAMAKLENDEPLTDADTEYILNNGPKPELSTDMWVGEDSYQLFTPENE